MRNILKTIYQLHFTHFNLIHFKNRFSCTGTRWNFRSEDENRSLLRPEGLVFFLRSTP